MSIVLKQLFRQRLSIKDENPSAILNLRCTVEALIDSEDSKLLLKFIGYFPDYLSVLSRSLLRLFFFFGQPCRYLSPIEECSISSLALSIRDCGAKYFSYL